MANWLDIKEIDRVKNRKEQLALARHRRYLLEGGGSDAGSVFDYNSDDETTSASIRDNKKQKLKQTRAIITQFDKLATNF